jgi:hypothetical protein
MTPAQFQQLLITHAPNVPGIAAAARRDDENTYGLTVTLAGGGRAWWTITAGTFTLRVVPRRLHRQEPHLAIPVRGAAGPRSIKVAGSDDRQPVTRVTAAGRHRRAAAAGVPAAGGLTRRPRCECRPG